MRRSHLLSIASLVSVLVALWLASSAPPPGEPGHASVVDHGARPPSAGAPPVERLRRRAAADPLPSDAPGATAPKKGSGALASELASDPTLAMALDEEKIARMELATARFDMGVAEGDFTAEQIDPGVIRAFEHVELEPQLDPDGRIVGLEITSIEAVSPILAAGFARGDRITEIGGVVLGDPAEVPATLVALSSPFVLCAQRGATRLCHTVTLE